MKKVSLLLLLGLFIFPLAACGGGNGESSDVSSSSSANQANVSNTKKESSSGNKKDSSLLVNNKKYKKLAINSGANDSKIIDEKDFKTSWSDNSWSGVNMQIDEVSILKVSDFKNYSDQEYQGFVVVHFIIDNSEKDVNLYPEQATLVTNSGEQTEGSYELDHFAGELMKGSKVQGYAAYPLTNLDSVDSINQIRLKFRGDYNTDDYNDENYSHDYDITIDLQ